MNIKDMAAKAGVSVATISRAINPETRNKVALKTLQAVDRLIIKYKYTPHLAARNLNKTVTKTIGVIFPYFPGIFYHPYYVNVLAGISDYLLNTEYQFKILLLKKEHETWDHYDFKKGEHVDGLIVTHWTKFFSSSRVLEKMTIPCVVVNDFVPGMKIFFVCGDQASGGKKVAEYLYGLGHRCFAVVCGSRSSTDSDLRFKGFSSFLKSKGIALNQAWVIHADYREDLAYEKVGDILKDKKKPTAIFCLSDQMAFGVLRKLKDLHIPCPQKISVVGFDNDPRAGLCEPPLASVEVPLYDLAAEGTRRIIAHLKSSIRVRALTGKVLFPVELIRRDSVQKLS